MFMQLSKLSSVVRGLHLPSVVEVSEHITVDEGLVLAVQAMEHEGKNSAFEFSSGRIGRLVKDDIFPGVLGKRRALREYSGDIPAQIAVGDTLYLLCESGIVGEIRGINEKWGVPMQVKVLGSITSAGKQLNIKDTSIQRQKSLVQSAPIVGVVGTSMDIGKTTAICKLIQHFKARGLKVAGVKLSGVASTQDLDKISDAGADPVLGFMDGGLPSTCGNATDVVEVALGILEEINRSGPDLIVAEFGDGILGEYNVEHLLRNPCMQKHICALIVGAADLVAAWGAKEILSRYGVSATVITGPAANNDTGALYIEKNLKVPAESNQHAMPKTIRLVEERIAQAQLVTEIDSHTPVMINA
jgi:Domain of unknown function (DUF1611_C) P-loop domain